MSWAPILEGGFEGQGGTLVGWIDENGNRRGPEETPPQPSLPAGVESYQIDNGGFEGQGGISTSYKIDGVPVGDFRTDVTGTASNGLPGGRTYNPFTGQMEKSYWATNINQILPESIARRIDPNALEYFMPADGGYGGGLGGLFDQYGTQALTAAVIGAGIGGFGQAGLGSVAGDLGSAAFPMDAGTIAGMNGTGAVQVGAGSLGSNLATYPLDGVDPSIWQELYGDYPNFTPTAGDIGSNSFPIFEGGPQVGANTTGATSLGQIFSNLPSGLQNVLRNAGLGSIFGNGGMVGNGTTQQNGGYQFPWKDVIGSVLEGYGANQQANTLERLMDKAIGSDMWRSQAPRYYEPLYEATTKGIGGTAYGDAITNKTLASLASRGYNTSGNVAPDVARALNAGTTDYVRAVTPLAMGRGESNAATALAPGVANAQNGVWGALGYGLGSVANGKQPNLYQQLFQGTPRNNTLSEAFALA